MTANRRVKTRVMKTIRFKTKKFTNIIIIIKIFMAHSYQFKIASEALKVCKRL